MSDSELVTSPGGQPAQPLRGARELFPLFPYLPGSVEACGGDMMVRASALADLGGFRDEMIAGEEPELCCRLRLAGHNVRQVRSLMFWGLAVPVAIAGSLAGFALSSVSACPTATAVSAALAAGLLLGYPALAVRVFATRRKAGDARSDAALYAAFCVLGKLPQGIGAVRFHRSRHRSRQLIEYK